MIWGRTGVDDWMDIGHLGMDALFDTCSVTKLPVVAAVNGICQGGGFMITLCSDLSVDGQRARDFPVPNSSAASAIRTTRRFSRGPSARSGPAISC